MTGTLRLLLAMIVAGVHFRPNYLTINVIGSATLVTFFVISGYAMTGLFSSRFAGRPTGVRRFYLDRILRIAPQYYFWMLVAIAIITVSRHSSGWHAFTFFQTGHPTWFNMLCNLSIFPVGFWPYFPSLATFQLVPPAWSLTIELAFYLLLPAILGRKWVLYTVTALSLAAFCMATQGIVDPVMYAYRVLPAPLLYVVIGHAMFARKHRFLIGIYAVLLVDFVVLILRHKLGMGFNPGVLLGVSLGAVLMRLSVAMRSWRFDDLAGRVSYGCYLAHWPLLTVIHPQDQHPWLGIPFALGAVLLGWISYRLVDLRILGWRRRLAGMKMPGTTGAGMGLSQQQAGSDGAAELR